MSDDKFPSLDDILKKYNSSPEIAILPRSPMDRLFNGEDLNTAFTTGKLLMKFEDEKYVAEQEIDIPENIVEFFKSRNCIRYTELTEEDQVIFRVRFC